MSTSSSPSPLHRVELGLYRRLLALIPEPVRRRHGEDMVTIFADRLAATRGSPYRRLRLWLRTLADVLRHAPGLRRSLRHGNGRFRSQERQSMTARLRDLLGALGRDTVFALRVLRKDWGFTLTATLILGLAIGANTAIFSFVDTYLLRPLPYPEPERLALVSRAFEGGGLASSQDGVVWEAVRDNLGEGMSTAVYSAGASRVNLATGSSAINVAQQRVGAGYFRTLGVTPWLGREFTPEEAGPGGPAVTILSHSLWQRMFDGDTGALGRSVLLKGEPHTVVGVMPPDFRSPSEAELWVPLRASTTGEGQGTNYAVLLRLTGETTWAEADARLAAIGRAVLEDYEGAQFDRLTLVSLQEADAASLEQPLELLWIAVGVVLLVACVNVSGLLLVRASRRSREIATRLAIGGGRGAVLRQLMVESLVLALLAGAVGVGIAFGLLRLLTEIGRGLLVTWRPVALDERVLLVTLGLSLATALVFGLAPALQAGRVSIQEALSSGGSRGSTGPGHRTRRILVVAEVALSVVLLVMAGLLLRSFLHLSGGDPGFDSDGLMAVSVSLADARYETGNQVVELLDEGIRRVEELSVAGSAAAALSLPYQRPLNIGFEPLDFEVAQEGYKITNFTYVTPGFFETLRMPILRGRAFDVSDSAEAEPVVVVSEAFAREYMPEMDPVGRSISTAGRERRIVGLAADVKVVDGSGKVEAPIGATPMIYVPAAQMMAGELMGMIHTWFAPSWVVRVAGPAAEAVPAIERALESVDPLLPLASTRLLDQIQAQSLHQERFMASLVTLLAAASIVLAALGIYGLVAASVTERRREIGIRLALGANAGHTLRVVAMPSIRLALVGAVVGIGGSILAARTVRALLWGVSPQDPWTYAGVGLTLLVAATIASLIPARRAARVDPARTLAAD